MKILIAVPCMDMLHTQFAKCLVDLARIAPPDTSVCFKQSSLIYDSRNLLSLTAIENGFDRILWLDSDVTFTQNTLLRLSGDMDKGYDLVTGIYVKRTMPTRPVLYKRITAPNIKSKNITESIEDYLHYPQDNIFPIAGCGFGCVMTSVDLVKRVWDKFGPAFSPYAWCGEDIAFCYRANIIGAKLACDPSVKCGHIGNVEFTEMLYLKNLEKERR